MKQQFNSLMDMLKVFSDEQKCIDHFAAIRWKNGIYCPHCGSCRKIHKFSDGKRYKCADCRKQFTVKVGTIFEDSKLPLQKWFMALYLVTSHKKGISSLQLSRDIDVTQKTAWFMLQRIRYVIQTASFNKPLDGIVEVDETYVGGKESNKRRDKRTKEYNKVQGDKTPILGMQQRKGDIALKRINKANKSNIKPIIDEIIDQNAEIHTDESPIYKFLPNRKYVNHSQGQYVHEDVTTNRIEGAFSHFKRVINGTYHWISKKHIQKYADMFSFRWNTRLFRGW